MKKRQMLQWGIVLTLVMSLLTGCGEASPTPVVVAPLATSAPVQPIPPAVLPRATPVPPTDVIEPTATQPTDADLTTTVEGEGIEASATAGPTENPIDQPFLMRIDRVSVIVGRGTLLEGRVVHGSLQANASVQILGPQNKVLDTSVLAVLIANTIRDLVTVGDPAGILVQSAEAAGVSPGMLLAEAGIFTTYEEALEALQ